MQKKFSIVPVPKNECLCCKDRRLTNPDGSIVEAMDKVLNWPTSALFAAEQNMTQLCQDHLNMIGHYKRVVEHTAPFEVRNAPQKVRRHRWK